MKHNYFPKIDNLDFHLQRSSKPTFTNVTVLSTEFLQNQKANLFRDMMKKVETLYPNFWYMHYSAYGKDAKNLVQAVPKVMHALNRSRPLRRAKVSGLRACCLTDKGSALKGKWHFISDFIFTDFFGAAVIASGLSKEINATYFDISFSTPAPKNNRTKRQELQRFNEWMLDKFYRRSHLSRFSVDIQDVTEDCLLHQLVTWRVTSTRMDLLDIANTMVSIFENEVEDIKFDNGYNSLHLSRVCTLDIDNYSERPIDNILIGFRFRRFCPFGIFHHHREYTIY